MYPSLTLEQALQRAEVLHDKCGEHTSTLEEAAVAWGQSPTSSGVLQAVSALKQYGLLADEGSREDRLVRLTDAALDILIHEPGSAERRRLIQEAALTPKLHRELWDKFGGSLPPNDGPLRLYLLRQREESTFNHAHVDSFISDFRETIAFAKLVPMSIIAMADDSESESSESSGSMSLSSESSSVSSVSSAGSFSSSTRNLPTNPAGKQAGQVLRIPVTLPTLKVAWLEVPERMTEAEFSTLRDALNLFHDALVVSPQVPADPQQPGPAAT
jgi:hypothetical protein